MVKLLWQTNVPKWISLIERVELCLGEGNNENFQLKVLKYLTENEELRIKTHICQKIQNCFLMDSDREFYVLQYRTNFFPNFTYCPVNALKNRLELKLAFVSEFWYEPKVVRPRCSWLERNPHNIGVRFSFAHARPWEIHSWREILFCACTAF